MGQQPPHITDQPILAQMKKLGIEPGKPFDIAKVDPIIARALDTAPEAGQKLMDWKLPSIARVVNGWSMKRPTGLQSDHADVQPPRPKRLRAGGIRRR